MKRTSSILTVLVLLLAALLAIASCTPTNQGGGATQPPVTTAPTEPADPDNGAEPQIGKTTIEFSVLSDGPALITYDLDGKRIKEVFEDGSMTYTYTEAGVLSRITLEMEGEEIVFDCRYDDNGVPTKAICTGEDAEFIDGLEFVFTYGENGKLTAIAYQVDGEEIYKITYGENGLIEQIAMYGGMATMMPTYNDDDYMNKASVKVQDMLLGEYTYTYSDDKQLIEILIHRPSESSAELELAEKTVITHTADSHKAEAFSLNEDGEMEKDSESLYDLDWNVRERSYYENGVVWNKMVYFKDTNGNKVTERYEMNEDSELVICEKKVEGRNEDGTPAWTEWWVSTEDGELYLECKTIYTDGATENQYYDPDGNLHSKSVETEDEDGNIIEKVYYPKSEGSEFYLAVDSKYNENYELLERYIYNEDGAMASKTLRRVREEGGYYLDHYEPNEDGEMELVSTEVYDEFGMPIPNQGGNENPPQNPGEEKPGEDSESIQNGGANTEDGWGPIQK